ncbi:hypothetical protein GWK47_050446 [Chionoecetes opilio]|uniref:Uncharacterized protein n=1 Tax=Chionoecetes opilio TaxID=41210 RepID=A0A8J5CE96_CHIOP|nr:hypothetical protein GWK47_050446 [Chionoecetes opilio]
MQPCSQISLSSPAALRLTVQSTPGVAPRVTCGDRRGGGLSSSTSRCQAPKTPSPCCSTSTLGGGPGENQDCRETVKLHLVQHVRAVRRAVRTTAVPSTAVVINKVRIHFGVMESIPANCFSKYKPIHILLVRQ